MTIAIYHALALAIPGATFATGKYFRFGSYTHSRCTAKEISEGGNETSPRGCVMIRAPAAYKGTFRMLSERAERKKKSGSDLSQFVEWG